MKSMRSIIVATVCALGLAGSADAAELKVGDDTTWLKLGLLLQTQAAFTENMPGGTLPADGIETEFYARRARILLTGQLNEKVNVFVETDVPNFGKGGDFSQDIILQDAFLELNLDKAFQLDIGMLIAPFSHHGMQGAGTLLGLDYHASMLRYAPGSNKIWRDMGLMIRGLLFDSIVEYRLAILNGVHGSYADLAKTNADGTQAWNEPTDPRNPDDLPRIVGRLTFNIFDAEGGAGLGGFFYDGLYLKSTDQGVVSTKKVLSLGGSVDWQKDLNVVYGPVPGSDPSAPADAQRAVAEKGDYLAAAGDIFADLPLDDAKLWSLNGQVNFYYYDHGDRREAGHYYNVLGKPAAAAFSGYGIASELGLRWSMLQPIVLFDWFNSTQAAESTENDGETVGDAMTIAGGLNFFWLAHNVAFKAQIGATRLVAKADVEADWQRQGLVQAQFSF